MSADHLQGFYLSDLFIEPLRGQVTGENVARHLPPKAVEVLLCLARTPGELVTREALLAEVWGPGRGSHEALSHAVSEIRHALRDHADKPVFVQTLPKRGYRLAVMPELAPQHTESTVIHPASSDGTLLGFIEKLRQRGVIETGIAYLVVGWLLIQIADIIFERLLFPSWAATFVTVLVIAGLPIAIALSWFLEIRDGRAVLDDPTSNVVRERRLSRTYISIVAALAVASVLVFVYDRQFGLPEATPQEAAAPVASIKLPPITANSFAVLPFLNIDGSDETQVFVNGLVEDVITQLSRVPGLQVSSRGDSYTLQPNSASQDVRHRLRVATYLEGSVEMAGDLMRVTVQMIDSESGFHILSRRFDRPREDFFDVRDEITNLTVANIRVALPPDVRAASLKVIEDPSLNAYVLYRRGVDAARQPKSIHTISSALGWFDAALSTDPEYAAAHAGKCTVFAEGYTEVDDPSFMASAESACAKALALNPNLDVVHTALGDLYRSTGRYLDAETEYQAALATDPSNAESLAGLGFIYLRQGRFDEAETALRKAVDIHPGNTRTYNLLGLFLYETGRYAEATQQYEYVVALEPDNMIGYTNLGAANMLAGNFDAAAQAYGKAIEIEPSTVAYSNLGLMHYYLGDLQAAIENHSNAVALQPNDHLARSNLGDALWIAGQEEDARHAFEKAEDLAQKALRVNPNDPFSMMDLAWIEAMLGNHDDARSLMNRVLSLLPDDPYTYYYDALVWLRVGDNSAALDALETAVAKGYSRQLLSAEPHLKALRGENRFISIVAGS